MTRETRRTTLRYPLEPERVIRLWLDEPATRASGRARSCIVVLHGFKGFAHWGFFPELARRLAAAGHVVARCDASGSGVGEDPTVLSDDEAFAKNTVSREVEDLERVRAWLVGGGVPEVDPARMGFVGHSMGGAVGLLHAALHGGWRALVTWAAVANLLRVDPEVLERWKAQGVAVFPNARTGQRHRLYSSWVEDIERSGARLSVPEACAAITAPTLLVHGAEDESVPLAEGTELAAAFAPGVARLLVVPGANHTFGATHPLGRSGPALEALFEHTQAHFAANLG
jgi:dienelactone hydrolase